MDGRIDQYALACVACELLTGAPPFERDQGMAVLMAHLSDPPPSVASQRPGLPAAVDQVLATALAKKPDRRYGSCREFAEALREALGLAPDISVDPVSAARHLPTEISSPRANPAPASIAPGDAAVPVPSSAPEPMDRLPVDLPRPARDRRPKTARGRRRALVFSSRPLPGTGPPRRRRSRVQRSLGNVPTAAIVVGALVLATAVSFAGFRLVTGTRNLASTGGQGNLPAMDSLPTYAGQRQRGVFQTINRIVGAGDTMVTTGSQTSDGTVRQQFFASSDGGVSWHLAPVQTPDGGQPPLGYLAPLIASSQKGWLAQGSQALWTSRNGLSWTLAATHGIRPQEPGDNIDVLTGTTDGFLAAGTDGNQAVIWISHDGTSWDRLTAARLGLSASGQAPTNISYAASFGNDTVISDRSSVWLSTDGGSAWTLVTVPAGYGAWNQISGVSFDGSGLIAVRPGTNASGAPDGVAYFSHDGQTWQFAGLIDPAGGWKPVIVKGSSGGFVVTGKVASQNINVAYTSTGTGTTWLPTESLGATSAVTIDSATVGAGGTVTAVGSTPATTISQRAVFVQAHPSGQVSAVSLANIPHGLIPAIAVNSTAVSDGVQIAVGSANGYPAVWRKTSTGTWSLVSKLSLVSRFSGLTALSSVTHGSAGWITAGAPGPVIFTSAKGTSWQLAAGNIAQDLAGASAVVTAGGQAGYLIDGTQAAAGGSDVAGWWSPNLTSWSGTQTAEPATGSNQVHAAAADADGFVTAGSHDGRPAVWTRANGQPWTTDVLTLPADASAGVLQQVAVNGNTILALGQQMTAAGAVPFAALSTNGGSTWQQTPFISTMPGTTVTALTARAGGFMAAGLFGTAGQQDAEVWTSASGTNWTQVPVSGLTGGGNHDITTMAPSGSAVTAIDSVQTQEGQKYVTVSLPAR